MAVDAQAGLGGVRTLVTTSPTSAGSMPPLVSHSAMTSAPAAAAVLTTSSA